MFEFFEAAFPWIVIGLVVAVGCVYINRKINNIHNCKRALIRNGRCFSYVHF